MPVVLTVNPVDTELAYGANILQCFNSSGGSNRIVAQIYNATNDSILADLRQLPNPSSYAFFDIQKILQSQVSQTPTQGDTSGNTTYLFTCPDESFDYYIGVGTVNSTGVVAIDNYYSSSVVDNYLAIPGRKPTTYTNGGVGWEDYDEYVPTISTFGGTNNDVIVDSYQEALTDDTYNTVLYSDITDGKPTGYDLIATTPVIKIPVHTNTDHTLQFLQRWIDGSTGGGAPSYYNGINYVRFITYNGNTLIADNVVKNTVSFGGGPNIAFNASTTPQGQYNILGLKTGFNSSLITANTTHMYVFVGAQKDDTFVSDEDTRISDVYRIDIVDGDCNDYDIIQVKWLNSLGGTDYFTFTKRNDEQITVSRNTFNKTNQDWLGTSWSNYSYDRGETVYNQSAEVNYVANTKYLSDDESQYLKNLYLSPDVKVKFGTAGNWESAILTSNTWTEKTYRKNKMFQHTINFKLANKLNMQGG